MAGRALDMSVPLMCGNNERQKARNSRDKERRRLGLAEDLWLGVDRRAAAAPGCLLRVVSLQVPGPGHGVCPQQCLSLSPWQK